MEESQMITLEDIVNAKARRGSELATWVVLSENNGAYMAQPLPLHEYMADDQVHCGACWSDFGNYKKFFPSEYNSLVQMWDFNPGNRRMFVYDTATGKTYSVKEDGSYSHSESCEDPRRRSFDKEIESLPEDFKKTLNFYLENYNFYCEHFQEAVNINYEMELKNRLLKATMENEEALKELLDLRFNHPRAWKKTQIAQEKADRISAYRAKLQKEYDEFRK